MSEHALPGAAPHILAPAQDVEVLQIACEPAHFDMIGLADDDGMETVVREFANSGVRVSHQRAGRLDHIKAELANAVDGAFRGAVRGDHHVFGLDLAGVSPELNTAAFQVAEHVLVVDEVAQDGDPRGGRALGCERDRIADAEAHASMLCA